MNRRLPWLFLILAVLLVIWMNAPGSWLEVPTYGRDDVPADNGRSHQAGPAGEVSGAARTKRPGNRRGAAEAKLRSLLEVRKGEMAGMHLSPEQTEQLATRIEASLGPVMNPADGAPAMVGMLNPAMVLGLFAATEEKIRGSIDASDDSFEWRGERLQITGSSLHEQESVRLEFTATEGTTSLQCITTVQPGTVVFLRSAGDRPEGLLLVVGGDAHEEIPPGDIGD